MGRDSTVEFCRRCGAGVAVVRHLRPWSSVPRKFGDRLLSLFNTTTSTDIGEDEAEERGTC
jgi:hypothetical protein